MTTSNEIAEANAGWRFQIIEKSRVVGNPRPGVAKLVARPLRTS